MKKYCVDMHLPNQERAIGEKDKFWKVGQALRVAFLDGTPAQQNAVKRFAIEWEQFANIKLEFTTDAANSEIRVLFYENWGSWSYVGTDNLFIDKTNPTMNLGWVTGAAADLTEDRAVILHEFGHALGLGHEHQSPIGGIKWNAEQVYKELGGSPNFWDKQTVDNNVLIPYNSNQVIGTQLDPKSIMMYPIPASWTLDGFSTGFNGILSELDKSFIASVYQKTTGTDEQHPFLETYNGLRFIFQTKKELNKLPETQIVRIGMIFSLPVNINKRKSENLDIVAKHLKLI